MFQYFEPPMTVAPLASVLSLLRDISPSAGLVRIERVEGTVDQPILEPNPWYDTSLQYLPIKRAELIHGMKHVDYGTAL